MKNAQAKQSEAAGGKHSPVRDLSPAAKFPDETLAAPAWRLPGGIRLADYALRGGFLASALLPRGDRARGDLDR